MRSLRVCLLFLLPLGLLGAGCSSSSPTTSTGSGSSAPGGTVAPAEVTVAAASSLKQVFTTIKDGFVKQNPGTNVTFTFDSSSTLEQQVENGAPMDVVAFADTDTMKKLADKSLLAGSSVTFAKNRLVIVTKPGNPKNVKTLADLATVGTVSLCGDTVPCGKYAKQILDKAKVTIPEGSVTRGQNVAATLSAVTDGDADAAIVYVTDAKSAGAKVAAVTIPDDQNAIAVYPMAKVKDAKNPSLANAFLLYLTSPDGQKALADAGFLAP